MEEMKTFNSVRKLCIERNRNESTTSPKVGQIHCKLRRAKKLKSCADRKFVWRREGGRPGTTTRSVEGVIFDPHPRKSKREELD